VRADEADVHLGDPGHPDEVVGAGEEHREGTGEGHVAAHCKPDRARHQLLLGDEHLEVPFRTDLLEFLGVGGVADLAVQDHDLGAGRQRCDGGAEGDPGRHLLPDLVGGQAERGRRVGGDRRGPGGRPAGDDPQIAGATQRGYGPLGHIRWQGLAVPAVLILDLRDAFGLDGAGQHHGRLVPAGAGLCQRAVDFRGIVPSITSGRQPKARTRAA